MKILIVTPIYPSQDDFILGSFVKEEVMALEERGLFTQVLVFNSRSDHLSVLREIAYNYDLVHVHFGAYPALVPSVFKLHPLIVTFHGSDVLIFPKMSSTYNLLTMLVVKRADALIAASQNIKKELIRTFKASQDRIRVITPGVDTSLFQPLNQIKVREKLGIPLGKEVVLYVGSLRFVKGVDFLFECARRTPNFLYIFVGGGNVRNDLKNCMFVGAHPHDEIPLWMNAADMLVLPSRSEGLPLALLEALSCCTPVIASNVGGCPEVIRHDRTGFLVPVGDISGLVSKISYLAENVAIRREMGELGREDMVKRYSRKIMVDRLYHVYKSFEKTK